MFQGIGFGAEIDVYGNGGVSINFVTGEAKICPTPGNSLCATLRINGDEIEIITYDTDSNHPQQFISGTISPEEEQLLNAVLSQSINSGEQCNGYTLGTINLKVINP